MAMSCSSRIFAAAPTSRLLVGRHKHRLASPWARPGGRIYLQAPGNLGAWSPEHQPYLVGTTRSSSFPPAYVASPASRA